MAKPPLDADEDPEVSEEQVEQEAEKKEMQTKKLMTVVKSKYFMLKANFPKAALEVDAEPIIANHVPEPKQAQSGANNDDTIRKKSMMNDPVYTIQESKDEDPEEMKK